MYCSRTVGDIMKILLFIALFLGDVYAKGLDSINGHLKQTAGFSFNTDGKVIYDPLIWETETLKKKNGNIEQLFIYKNDDDPGRRNNIIIVKDDRNTIRHIIQRSDGEFRVWNTGLNSSLYSMTLCEGQLRDDAVRKCRTINGHFCDNLLKMSNSKDINQLRSKLNVCEKIQTSLYQSSVKGLEFDEELSILAISELLNKKKTLKSYMSITRDITLRFDMNAIANQFLPFCEIDFTKIPDKSPSLLKQEKSSEAVQN